MKKFMHLCLLSAGIAGWSLAGQAAEQKIATFNLRKAFDGYYKTIQSNAGLKQDAAELDKQIAQLVENGRKHEADWRSLIDKANDQSLSAEEREKNKKAAADKYAELQSDKDYIAKFNREADARFQEKKRQRTDDIIQEIRAVVEAHAKSAGYSMVLDQSGDSLSSVPVVLYTNGQDDLTDSIMKDLNAAAPPGSLDTNSPPASASPAPNPPANLAPPK